MHRSCRQGRRYSSGDCIVIEYMALFTEYKALSTEYMALFVRCTSRVDNDECMQWRLYQHRAFFTEYKVLSTGYMALFMETKAVSIEYMAFIVSYTSRVDNGECVQVAAVST